MEPTAQQHLREIQANLQYWNNKPLLHDVYALLYGRILPWINTERPEAVVEIGSGIGNLKAHLPESISTDLFPNPWLDLACDAYELPFLNATISHLVLFDVFHHLQKPAFFLEEARRVLAAGGRVILMEPFISWFSRPVYQWLHHEPVGWRHSIDLNPHGPKPSGYYASQGNATRLLYRNEAGPDWPYGWVRQTMTPFSAFSWLLSGGYSKPAFYPQTMLPLLKRMDQFLTRWPGIFASRCLAVLEKSGG